ncbi:MAG: PAS domain S-box protein [Gammaproteobacteria bacterium]|nr:PAS domain S-box protein [Gammaproteobacteria bacterium]MBT7229305.1 PAS domain S-box protein [Gammaproteobacteria bacterium]
MMPLSNMPTTEPMQFPQQQDNKKIIAEQVRLLYGQGYSIQVLGLLTSLIAVYLFWGVVEHAVLTTWCGGLWVSYLIRMYMGYRFRNQEIELDVALVWGYGYVVGAFVTGVIWGGLALQFDPSWPVSNQIMLFVLYTGITAGAFNTHSYFFPAFPAFYIPPVATLMVMMALQSATGFQLLSLLILIYALLMFLSSRIFHRESTAGITAKLHNGALAEMLADSNQELEQRVADRTEELLIANQEKSDLLIKVRHEMSGILNSMDDGVIVIDAEGVIQKVNPKLLEMVDTTAEAVHLQLLDQRVVIDEQENTEQDFSAWMQWLIDDEIEQLFHSNQKIDRWCQEVTFPMLVVDEQGTIQGITPSIVEVTGWRQNELMEQTLEQLIPERYRSAHTQMVKHFIEAPQSRPMSVGKTLPLLHKSGEETEVVIGLSPIAYQEHNYTLVILYDPQVIGGDYIYTAPLSGMLRRRNAYVEGKLLCSHGEKMPVQISGALLHDDNRNKIEGAVIVLHDLTNRLHQERQAQYASFQAGAADTGALVLHNLGNSLTGLGGVVSEINDQISLVEQLSVAIETMNLRVEQGELNSDHVHQALEKISVVMKGVVTGDDDAGMRPLFEQLRAETSRMGNVIKSFSGISKEEGKRNHFNLHEALNDAVNLAGLTASQLDIETSVECNHPIEIFQYRNQLIQVLLHLLHNSIDAILARRCQISSYPGQIKVSAIQSDADNRIEIQVEDNGCGVDPTLQSQLFALGYSTKGKAGQGLHYMANYMTKEAGEFSFESAGANQGATVQIRLPIEYSS